MRILHVITDTDRRGAQVFATDLHAALVTLGHDSSIVAIEPGTNGGLEIDTIAVRRWSFQGWRELRMRMRHADATIAHGSSTLIACRLAGMATTSVWYYRQISDTWFWANTPLRRARVRWSMRGATAVVCLSESARMDIHQNLGIRLASLVVVPNGVPEAGFQSADPRERSKARFALGVPESAPVIAVVSALVPEKGIDIVIHAMAHLGTDVHLVIAGDGPERGLLTDLGESIAPGRVHLLGQVSDAVHIYHGADVVTLASRGGDSMPAALIEAGLCGIPVVATDVGSITDVVIDGETGFILTSLEPTELAERLTEAVTDTRDSRRLGRNARSRMLEHFEIRQVAKRWLEVIAQPVATADSGADEIA